MTDDEREMARQVEIASDNDGLISARLLRPNYLEIANKVDLHLDELSELALIWSKIRKTEHEPEGARTGMIELARLITELQTAYK